MKIEGLDELINRLNLKEKETPKAISEAVNKLGNSLKERTVRKTPIGKSYKNHTGGTLKRSWHVKKVDASTVIVYNPEHYAPHVEYGHRTRLGSGKSKGYKPKESGIKYVEGVYMLTKSLEGMDDLLGNEFDSIIQNLWKD